MPAAVLHGAKRHPTQLQNHNTRIPLQHLPSHADLPPQLTKLLSSSTLTAKSLSLSPSEVNTPTASSCSPTFSAGDGRMGAELLQSSGTLE